MLTLEICLPLLVIVGCLLIGLIVDLKNGDHLLRRNEDAYRPKHGRRTNNE